MNIRKSFCFFMGVAILLSMVICQPPWLGLKIGLRALYSQNKNIKTDFECVKNTEISNRFTKAFQTMKEQTLHHLQESYSDTLRLPVTLTENDIIQAAIKDILDIKKTFEELDLIKPMCELIKTKCSIREDLKNSTFNSTSRNILKLNMSHTPCRLKKETEFSYAVLVEEQEGTTLLTAFVYKKDGENLDFKACLPLLIYPNSLPEVKLEDNEP